jgi:hypothetical protein
MNKELLNKVHFVDIFSTFLKDIIIDFKNKSLCQALSALCCQQSSKKRKFDKKPSFFEIS